MTAAASQDVATSATANPDTPDDTWFTALRRSFYVIRIPIAMAIIVAVVLIIPEQVQEIYRALAQDRTDRHGFQLHWLLALVSLVALSLVLWQVARGLSYQYPRHYGAPRHPVARWVLAWVPRMMVAVPLLSAALGLWLSIVVPGGKVELLENFVDGVNRLRLDFAIAIGTSIVVALLLLMIATAFERRMARRGPDVARKVALYSNWVVFPLIAAGSVVFICTDQVAMPQLFGAIPIFALWMTILALLVGMLARLSLFAIPVLSLVVVYGLGIEFLKLADNHEIRGQPKEIQRPDLDTAFKQWLANRKDFAAYRDAGRPYPVYIVAAEGGGLYAGYMTVQLLARIQILSELRASRLHDQLGFGWQPGGGRVCRACGRRSQARGPCPLQGGHDQAFRHYAAAGPSHSFGRLPVSRCVGRALSRFSPTLHSVAIRAARPCSLPGEGIRAGVAKVGGQQSDDTEFLQPLRSGTSQVS